MGDHADDAAAMDWAYEEMMERAEELAKAEVWETRDGRQVKIKDMKDSHLINTIKWLAKKSDYSYIRSLYQDNMKDEAKKRGLM